jgi:hypothetical protein
MVSCVLKKTNYSLQLQICDRFCHFHVVLNYNIVQPEIPLLSYLQTVTSFIILFLSNMKIIV